MGGNEEHGIAQSQIAAAKAQSGGESGLQRYHNRSIRYLNERILVYLFMLSLTALIAIWITTTSTLLLFGSLGFAILMLVLWGVVRIIRILRLRESRDLDVRNTRR